MIFINLLQDYTYNFQILSTVYAATLLTTSISYNHNNLYNKTFIHYILSITYSDHLYKHFNLLIL
jgi:hypothetical protein